MARAGEGIEIVGIVAWRSPAESREGSQSRSAPALGVAISCCDNRNGESPWNVAPYGNTRCSAPSPNARASCWRGRALGASPSAVTRAGAGAGAPGRRAAAVAQQEQRGTDPQGESYFEYARGAAAPGKPGARGLPRRPARRPGRLRFSAPDLLGVTLLPAVLRRYAAEHPGVTVDIHYTDKAIDPIAEGLDFAIRGGFPASSDLLGGRLWPYERLLCASPDYVARLGLPREPEELARHRLIMHTGPRVLKDWHLRRDKRIVRMHAEPGWWGSAPAAA
ncbi:lysR substrate binding domain-containing protein [Ditylenchus destructor]|uniref:LysR substrate binding domain-containing protein n=1 Tax=Ditylenchus destructor TaxID=166010 RepID=A0AAD4MEX5_9BILA|nr:lysR substrate binding domain-containing protein [Ditylenchus destructor]